MQESDKRKPSHRAYTVRRREEENEHWIDIGLAFSHRDGNGFDVVFDALPVNGVVVLRKCYEDKE